jgi:glycine/D-amino acid oxidase-like deaminating enzyme
MIQSSPQDPSSTSDTAIDVAILGGGPAGIAAAIAAARMNRRVRLIEKHPFLGGMGTAALVSNFCNAHWDSRRFIIGGIFGELRRLLIESDSLHVTGGLEPYDPASLIRHVNTLCLDAGVEVQCDTTLRSVQFTPGRPACVTLDDGSAFHASTVVDATGDAMVAHAAGVPGTFGRASDQQVMPLTWCYILGPIDLDHLQREMPEAFHQDQRTGRQFVYLGYQQRARDWVAQAREAGELTIPRDRIAVAFGLPGRPDHVAVNFGRVFIKDPTDPTQLAQASRQGREQVDQGVRFFQKYIPGFDKAALVELARQIGVRQSRQIIGRYTLTAQDVLACTQFDDVIAQCCYSIDIHEPDSDKTTLRGVPKGAHYDIPWRCLVPEKGPANLVVAGRSISATAQAMSSLRVTPSVMAIGEAAGVGAALASAKDGDIHSIPHRAIQQRLRDTGGILA